MHSSYVTNGRGLGIGALVFVLEFFIEALHRTILSGAVRICQGLAE